MKTKIWVLATVLADENAPALPALSRSAIAASRCMHAVITSACSVSVSVGS